MRRQQERDQEGLRTASDGFRSVRQEELRWSQLSPIVDQLLEGLSKRDRLAILLRYYEGRPFGEIGRAIEVSEDGARMRVQRALEQLRANLEKRGIRSSSVALSSVIADNAIAAAPAGLAANVATSSAVALTMKTAPALFALMGTMKTVSAVVVFAIIGVVGALEWREQARLTDGYRELGLEREKLSAQERHGSEDTSARTSPPSADGTAAYLPNAALPPNEGKAHSQKEDALRKRFGPFFKQRGLSTGQIDRFIGLMLRP